MKKLLIISIALLVGGYGFGQKIKTIEAFKYEQVLNDSVVSDTSLFKAEHYDKNGFKYKHTTYYNNIIIKEEQFFGDSLRYVYLQDPKINPENRIEYRMDEYGNVTSIISPTKTHYKNYYEDTLLVKSMCDNGGYATYLTNEGEFSTTEYFYNKKGDFIKTIEYGTKNDTTIATWEYDEENRIVTWNSPYGSITRFEYTQNPKTEVKYYIRKDDGVAYEKTITYYDLNSDKKRRMEWYQMDKLIFRAVYKYTYY